MVGRFCSKSPSVSIRLTICHEHACAAFVRCMFAIAYGENEFMLLQIKGLVWGTGQALLKSPRGRKASRDGLVKLGWVHCLQYTLNCFQYNVCDLY